MCLPSTKLWPYQSPMTLPGRTRLKRKEGAKERQHNEKVEASGADKLLGAEFPNEWKTVKLTDEEGPGTHWHKR